MNKRLGNILKLLMLLVTCPLVVAHPRAKDFRETAEVVASKNGVTAEPSCEELKAMWRFSKRQSRAAEITNEIPMYRDPFISNVWESYYPNARGITGQRLNKYRNRPVYGVLVHNPPYFRMRDNKALRNKHYAEIARWYQSPIKNNVNKNIASVRVGGGGRRNDVIGNSPVPSMNFPPQQGSFQHLKELIKTERARELQQQRATEEAAARAAVLKDLSKENHVNRGFYDHYDFIADDEYNPVGGIYSGDSHRPAGYISYLDMPPARPMGHMLRFSGDNVHSRKLGRFKPHRPSFFDSKFETSYSGYIP